MNRSKREFLLRTAAIGIGAHTQRASAADAASGAVPRYVPSAHTQRLLSTLGLAYPIFQGPLGPGIGPNLAIAVSNAGALGAVSLWALSPEQAQTRMKAVRSGTTKPFAVNYVLAFEPRSLQAALEAGAPIVQFSWGMPGTDLIAVVRQAGAKFGIQVTSSESARAALDLGPDYLVCQGTEAGGHVQASYRLSEALPKVLDAAKQTPVIAAGGMANGLDIRKVLSAGAAAAMLGTRFVATRECSAHPQYKDALVRANGSDTVLTGCFDGGWPYALHRVLRNRTFIRWEAAGCPLSGKRPGERDVVAIRADGSDVLRYAAALPVQDFTGAALLDCALYAGEGVGLVRDIPSAGALVHRLWNECVMAAQGTGETPNFSSSGRESV